MASSNELLDTPLKGGAAMPSTGPEGWRPPANAWHIAPCLLCLSRQTGLILSRHFLFQRGERRWRW